MINIRWLLVMAMLMPVVVEATCVTLDMSTWTVKQREYAQQVCSVDAAEACTLRVTDPVKPSFMLCAKAADISGFKTATLLTEAEAARLVDVGQQTSLATGTAAINTELSVNDLCNAELVDITSRIDAVKNGLDTEVNGISTLATAKPVLLDINTAYATALKKIARCLVATRKAVN